MKKLIALFTLAAIAAWPAAGFSQTSIENDPGYLPIDKVLDLKANPPQVNVNLPQFLLKDALSGLSNTNLGTQGMDLADLVKDVKLIRVVVFDGIKTNQAAVKKAVKTLQAELNTKWTSIVSVADANDNVGIYAMGDKSGEKVAGVAVLVHDGNDAIIANVVGNVSIGKLIKAASQSKMIPKDLLKGLENAGEHPVGPSAKKKRDAGHHSAATNAPTEAPENSAEKPAAE